MSDDAQGFWSAQVSSLHRSSEPRFFEEKASEHAALIPVAERNQPVVDLGCGAGELLHYFADHVNVQLGLDYSESMLDQARALLSDRDIELSSADAFEFLPTASQPTWTTTGALNQYLDATEIARLVAVFANNEKARAFYLFDTVDPLRYRLLPLGISYAKPSGSAAAGARGWIVMARKFAAKALATPGVVAAILSGRLGIRLGGPGMGYGYRPSFWHGLASRHGLDIEIVSSRLYEYRYHVLLRKGGDDGD
jgi:SAM-dependent methyltransferase